MKWMKFLNVKKMKKKIILKYSQQLYQKKIPLVGCLILYPLSLIFASVSITRRWLYKKNILKTTKIPVPVVVVGNINVGGTGKTPLVIWLCQYYQRLGYTPGIVTRGYGIAHTRSLSPDATWVIDKNSYQSEQNYPDEAHLCWLKTKAPIAISKNRVAAAKQLVMQCDCNLIISDDGLQHYALQRDFEIAVVDDVQGFGSGHLLPLGPLRESLHRLAKVNAIVRYSNRGAVGQHIELSNVQSVYARMQPGKIYNLKKTNHEVDVQFFQGKKIYAVAGIGNPQKFFNSLHEIGITRYHPIIFPDHFNYIEVDFSEFSDGEIIMTEKDAVKCFDFCRENFWALPVTLLLSEFNPPEF